MDTILVDRIELPYPPQNLLGGFWSAMKENAAGAWRYALPAIASATTSDPDAVRAFLDSRWGRHFADDVRLQMHCGASIAQAVDNAIAQWMTWRISPYTAQVYELPQGLSYLRGFLHLSAFNANAAQ